MSREHSLENSDDMHNICFEKDLNFTKLQLSLSKLFQAASDDIYHAILLLNTSPKDAISRLDGIASILSSLAIEAKKSSQILATRQNRSSLDFLEQ